MNQKQILSILILTLILTIFMIMVFSLSIDNSIILLIPVIILVAIYIVINPFSGICFYIFSLMHPKLIQRKLFDIYIPQLFLLIVGSSFLLYYMQETIISKDLRDLKKIFFCMIGYTGSILFVSLINGSGNYLQIFFYAFKIFLLPLMIISSIKSKKRLDIFLIILISSGILLISVGIVELLIGKTFFYSLWTLTERYRFGIMRMGSTVADPNYICFAIVPLIPIASYFFKTRKGLIKIYFCLIIIFFVSGIFLTVSRIGILTLAFIFTFMYYQKNILLKLKNPFFKKILLMLFVIFILIGSIYLYFIITESTESELSTNTRTNSLLISLYSFWKHPLVGVGMHKLEMENALFIYSPLTLSGGISSMNTYIKILAENGIISFIFFILLIILTYKRISAKEIHDEIFSFVKISLIAWLIIALTLDSMGTIVFWCIVSISMLDDDLFRNEEGIN